MGEKGWVGDVAVDQMETQFLEKCLIDLEAQRFLEIDEDTELDETGPFGRAINGYKTFFMHNSTHIVKMPTNCMFSVHNHLSTTNLETLRD